MTVHWLLPLRPDTEISTIVTPSLPTGASVFVLAERYATYTRRASCLVPHAFAVFTVTAVLIWASG